MLNISYVDISYFFVPYVIYDQEFLGLTLKA